MKLSESDKICVQHEIMAAAARPAWGHLYESVVLGLLSIPEDGLTVPIQHYVRRTLHFERPRFYQKESEFWSRPIKHGGRCAFHLHLDEADQAVSTRSKAPVEYLIEEEDRELLDITMGSAMKTLTCREQSAVAAKAGLPDAPTIRDLAKEWNYSEQWVYQIATNALRRVRKILESKGFYP